MVETAPEVGAGVGVEEEEEVGVEVEVVEGWGAEG